MEASAIFCCLQLYKNNDERISYNLNLYQEFINAYNEAIKLNPSYHEVWSNKSAPLNKLKRFLEASEACDTALSLKPDYAEGWSNKGVTLNELKRYDEVIARC